MMGFPGRCVSDLAYLSTQSITWAGVSKLAIAQALVRQHPPPPFIHFRIIFLSFKAFCTSPFRCILYLGGLFQAREVHTLVFKNCWSSIKESTHFSYAVTPSLNWGCVLPILFPRRRMTVSKTWKSIDFSWGRKGTTYPYNGVLHILFRVDFCTPCLAPPYVETEHLLCSNRLWTVREIKQSPEDLLQKPT